MLKLILVSRNKSVNDIKAPLNYVIPQGEFSAIVGRGGKDNHVDIFASLKSPDNGQVISRQHAELWRPRGSKTIFIKDMDSLNGVFVNNKKVKCCPIMGICKFPILLLMHCYFISLYFYGINRWGFIAIGWKKSAWIG